MYINPLNVLSMRNIIIDNVNTTKSKYVIFKQFNDTNLSNPFRKLTQMKHSSYSKNTCAYAFWYHATLILHSLSLKYMTFVRNSNGSRVGIFKYTHGPLIQYCISHVPAIRYNNVIIMHICTLRGVIIIRNNIDYKYYSIHVQKHPNIKKNTSQIRLAYQVIIIL